MQHWYLDHCRNDASPPTAVAVPPKTVRHTRQQNVSLRETSVRAFLQDLSRKEFCNLFGVDQKGFQIMIRSIKGKLLPKPGSSHTAVSPEAALLLTLGYLRSGEKPQLRAIRPRTAVINYIWLLLVM